MSEQKFREINAISTMYNALCLGKASLSINLLNFYDFFPCAHSNNCFHVKPYYHIHTFLCSWISSITRKKVCFHVKPIILRKYDRFHEKNRKNRIIRTFLNKEPKPNFQKPKPNWKLYIEPLDRRKLVQLSFK